MKTPNLNGKEMIGTSILGLTLATSIWAAMNSSVYSVRNFTKSDKDELNARKAMNLGLGTVALSSLAFPFLYGKKGTMPGIVTATTGLLFYLYYDYTLRELKYEREQGILPSLSTSDMNSEYVWVD